MDDHCDCLNNISKVSNQVLDLLADQCSKNQVLGDGARALNTVALQQERHRHHSGCHELPLLWHEPGYPASDLQEKLPWH